MIILMNRVWTNIRLLDVNFINRAFCAIRPTMSTTTNLSRRASLQNRPRLNAARAVYVFITPTNVFTLSFDVWG